MTPDLRGLWRAGKKFQVINRWDGEKQEQITTWKDPAAAVSLAWFRFCLTKKTLPHHHSPCKALSMSEQESRRARGGLDPRRDKKCKACTTLGEGGAGAWSVTPNLRHLRRARHVHVINEMVVRATSTHGMHCTDKKAQQLCTGSMYYCFTRDGILLKKRLCTHIAFFSNISVCQQKMGYHIIFHIFLHFTYKNSLSIS